jgi:hypothetical protein
MAALGYVCLGIFAFLLAGAFMGVILDAVVRYVRWRD